MQLNLKDNPLPVELGKTQNHRLRTNILYLLKMPWERARPQKKWRPQGDSNPCCRRERAVS